jgi:C-terminal processing protease CtpA/Prc
MPAFDTPDAAREEMKRVPKSKALILDLRSNGGGRVAGSFSSRSEAP